VTMYTDIDMLQRIKCNNLFTQRLFIT